MDYNQNTITELYTVFMNETGYTEFGMKHVQHLLIKRNLTKFYITILSS